MKFQIEFNRPTPLNDGDIFSKLGATYYDDVESELEYWFIELNSIEDLDAFIEKVEDTLGIYWSVIVTRDPMVIFLDDQF